MCLHLSGSWAVCEGMPPFGCVMEGWLSGAWGMDCGAIVVESLVVSVLLIAGAWPLVRRELVVESMGWFWVGAACGAAV